MQSELITNCLHRIAKREGFTDYKIEATAGSKHGDNFLGVMSAITLSGTRRQNSLSKSEVLHLICKAPPLNQIRKKNWKSKLVFDREIYVYTKLLPAFVRFQAEKGLSEADSFRAFPKVYECEVDEESEMYILIMEDLRVKNFEMWPKEKMISLDHELLVLRELAKFHALSFAMKDQRPAEFDEFKQQLKDVSYEIVIGGSLKSFIHQSVERLENALERPEHKQLVQNFQKRYLQVMEEFLVGPSSTEFAVIRHGDCWNNNFLFQYAGNKELKSINFLDWQLSHYSSPALDLLYNIFSSTDKEFRDKHYFKLLDAYYSSLSETIRKLGSDPNKLYSYENFRMQLRKFGEYALLMATMIISIRVAKANDVLNLDEFAELSENGKDVELIHKFDGKTQKEYSELVNGIVTDLIKYGYIGNK